MPSIKNRIKLNPFSVGLGLIIFLIAAVLIISVYVGFSLLTPERQAVDEAPSSEFSYEEVQFSSLDGEENLSGWFLEGEMSNGIIIFAHGYGQNRLVDEVGLSLAEDYLSEGYKVLMFDFRNSGESSGDRTTIGQYEKYDLLGAVEFVSSEYVEDNEPIILHGFSMGAATAIIAGAEDSRVDGVIADSPFDDLFGYLEDNLSYWTGLPEFPFNYTILTLTPIVTDLDPDKVSPVKAVEDYDIPLLLIHGDEDETIPYEVSKYIKYASSDDKTELVIIPGADHVVGYLEDREKYMGSVFDFIDYFK
ncbi:alpha/beta hydrolase [Natranaerofaba carboxydovora]|uniref:alpha/beta hydrolase n=1 Tax=Natranaerofaba carboxydovora TaxID=2742683 RepID=UPI001F13E80B|nr:alpha/beta hydrolase [Natranaerofaba carboxydovora]UMZ72733.1 Serine aminopeptidase, S33 [Natranaerofaba carboxydovora]